MPIEKTLEKALQERERGEVRIALTRVQGLVGTYPHRLDLRQLLADLYRQSGDPIQAGRWSYLSDERSPREIAAFEKAARTPLDRMRAMKWRGAPEEASSETARERLLALREEARESQGDRELDYTDLGRWEPSTRTSAGEALGIGCGVVVLALFAIGVVNGVIVLVGWAF